MADYMNLPLTYATPIDSVKQEIMSVFGISFTIVDFMVLNNDEVLNKYPKAGRFFVETVREAVTAFLAKAKGASGKSGQEIENDR
jgi:hypothetical protein